MSIRQTPEKKWFYRFQYKGHDYCEGGFLAKDQALRAEVIAKHKAIRDDIHPERRADDMTFAEASQWFFDKHGVKKRSGQGEWYQLELLGKQFGSRKLREITPTVVEDVIDALQKKQGFGDHTWNHYLASVKVVYNYLKKKRVYDRENPAQFVDIKKVPRARVRFLYPAEEKILTPEVCKDPLVWPYYYVALHTGMRLGELCRIQIKDVYVEQRHIFIANAKNSRSRHIPMSEDVTTFVEPLLRGKGDEEYLLPHFTRTHISRRFIRLLQKAGLKNFRFHDLRHTFAANLLSRGAPIYKVSQILGHSGVQVTEQHYGHLSMAELKSAIDKIDGVVSWPVQKVAIELQ